MRVHTARPARKGKKACVGLLMCCLTLGPLLMFFLFPRYPLIEYVTSVSPGTVGDFTIQIDVRCRPARASCVTGPIPDADHTQPRLLVWVLASRQYYWNFQNWNYVTAYFDTFEYTVTAPGLLLGYGQNASVVELAGRTITPVRARLMSTRAGMWRAGDIRAGPGAAYACC